MIQPFGFDGDSGFRITAAAPAKPANLAAEIAPSMARILRPQAMTRWLLPVLSAITPQYVESVLRSALAGNHVQQWELFDLMLETWPELSACWQELVTGVLRSKMIFEAYQEEDEEPTAQADEKMKVVSAALRGMKPRADMDENDLDRTISDLADAFLRGVTVLETEWHMLQAGKLGSIVAPRCTYWVHPTCYTWGQDGVLGLRTTGVAGQLPIVSMEFPEHKFLIGIHKAKAGTVFSGPLLRVLAWWWCAANFSSDWLLNLAQIFGLPFRSATYDRNAPQATVDAICNMLQNMGSAGWGAFPEGSKIDFMEAGKGSDHSPQGELLDRADRYVRLVVLGQSMTGGHGGMGKGGGQAFGTVEAEVKSARIESAAKFVASVLNNQLIPSIVSLNYGNCEECPTVRFLEDKEASVQDAQKYVALAQGGLKMPASFLRKVFDIPEPKDEEEVIGGEPKPEPDPKAPNARQLKLPGEAEAPEVEAKRAEENSLEESFVEAAAGAGAFSGQIEELQRIAALTDDQEFTRRLNSFAQSL